MLRNSPCSSQSTLNWRAVLHRQEHVNTAVRSGFSELLTKCLASIFWEGDPLSCSVAGSPRKAKHLIFLISNPKIYRWSLARVSVPQRTECQIFPCCVFDITYKSHSVPCFQGLPSTLQVNRIHNPWRGTAGAPLTPLLMLGYCQPKIMNVTRPESKNKHDLWPRFPDHLDHVICGWSEEDCSKLEQILLNQRIAYHPHSKKLLLYIWSESILFSS